MSLGTPLYCRTGTVHPRSGTMPRLFEQALVFNPKKVS